MGIFGERCVRCGRTRTRREFEGLPTCDACEAQIRYSREEQRICPLDGSAMQKEIVLNIVIDRCPSCRGVWLDGGELQLLRQAAKQEGLSEAVLYAIAPPF